MGELKAKPPITVEQYLAMERASDERHEYLDGVVYDMAGETREHGDVISELKTKKPLITIEQYLAMERASDERHEYLDGIIYDMAGESLAHGHVSVNIVGSLWNQLKGTPCCVLTKDSKVRSGPSSASRATSKGMFSYPDVFVVCGEPKYFDEREDVILNPRVVIEILSPTTERFDRGDKCDRFQTYNETLTDYLLVSQDQPRIEHFSRKPEGGWSFDRLTGLEAAILLPSIKCTLALRDVYDRVSFSSAER